MDDASGVRDRFDCTQDPAAGGGDASECSEPGLFSSPVRTSACTEPVLDDCPTVETLLATGFSVEEIAAMTQEARQAPVCDAMLRSPSPSSPLV